MSLAARVDSLEHGLAMDEALLERLVATGSAWTPTLAAIEQVVAAAPAGSGAARWGEQLENLQTLLAQAVQRGVPVLAGTDTLPHGAIVDEIAALQRRGLSPRQALAAASTTARAFLGAPALVEGAPADLVLYTADPRNDPDALRRPDLMLLGGARVALPSAD